MKRIGGFLIPLVASLVVALTAVGLYASRREVTAARSAVMGCEFPFEESVGLGCVIRGPVGNFVTEYRPLMVLAPGSPEKGTSGPLGRDAAIWWWFAAGALTLITAAATAAGTYRAAR